jgi:CheY-like chemotaxis protein
MRRVSETPNPKTRLLVVDDDVANLKTFNRVFRQDYDVVMAGSAAEALEKLCGGTFDVALVDYAMPGMNGLELFRAMQTAHPDVKRVMLTAHGDLPELEEALARGVANALVMKPWQRTDIEQVVADAMRLPATRGTAAPGANATTGAR